MTSAINSGFTATPRTSEGNQIGDGLGKDAFMKLLVTQIQNQNPLDPMDARDTVAQLAQLTSVEKLAGIETRLQGIELATSGVANGQAVSWIGAEVDANSELISLPESGVATSGFLLGGDASKVQVRIRDADGNVVRTLELGAHTPGSVRYSWDGRDNAGTRVPSGRYTADVSAERADGARVTVERRVRGAVAGVSFESGFPELEVAGVSVRLGDVRRIER